MELESVSLERALLDGPVVAAKQDAHFAAVELVVVTEARMMVR
jgi:hypothetical protein